MAGRGRPKKKADEQIIRKALLSAAASCLSKKSYSLISIRELAETANTTSAMISYYFGGKQGLVTALLHSLFEEPTIQQGLLPNLENIKPEQRTQTLVVAFLSLTHQHPWLFRMIIDDLVNQNQEIRQMLVDTVAGESNRLFDQYFQLQIAAGYFHNRFDRALAKTSLLSLLAFPFLAAPILGQAYAVDINTVRKGQLVNHIVTTFEASLLNPSI